MHDFTPLPSLMGGALIGVAASLFFVANGRIAGVSGMLGRALATDESERSFRLLFVLGLLLGGALLAVTRPSSFELGAAPKLPVLMAAGLLVGVGTRLGNGCTSGHGVCGIARGSIRSLTATMVFMFVAGLTVFVVRRLTGGAS
jgi:uncharacterized membrane protein YedE/YeeE